MRVRLGAPGGTAVPAQAVPAASTAAKRAEHRAWLVLCAAFMSWCALALVGAGALLNYRETADEPQRAVVSVARGSVSYLPSSEAEPRLITRERVEVLDGTAVQTGPNAQASLTLFDGSQVRLLSEARLDLMAMRSGRFDAARTRLDMHLADGPAWLEIAGSLPSDKVVVDVGPAQVRLGRGEYLLWPQQDTARISVYQGHATLVDRERQAAVASGQRAHVSDGALIQVLPLDEDLLDNGSFASGLDGWRTLDDLEVRSDSLGQRRVLTPTPDGKEPTALWITRLSALNRHNKTGVIQEVNRNVRGFRSLLLRAKVRVVSAELHGGGYAGTEYPMTFVVYYVDDKGGEPNWIHGFFYKNDEGRPAQYGQLIPQDTWYQYEVDLMAQPDRPAHIKSVWVFGAGHDFEAMVANLQLVAR